MQKTVGDILSEEVMNTKEYDSNTKYYNHSSAIIEDSKTGEILAMPSKKAVGNKIVDDTELVITNAIMPGSIVKSASMLVEYNTGAIMIGEKLVDEWEAIAGTPKKCSWRSLGLIDDITALTKSSNVYQFKTTIRINGSGI